VAARAAGAPLTRTLFAVEQQPAAGGGPTLAGIVGRLPDQAVALVRLPDGRSRSVAIGGVVDGWTLVALSADAALFTRGGERARVAVTSGEDQS
ncbi:MAG: hypothetical protein INR70_44045, partial [Parafilimonas terrae]|nr:hypothetical protein [Parafilimonas terrae]